jgi:hypothetical protein
MNEYSNLGNNKDNIKEEISINEVLKNFKKIENSDNYQVQKDFINRIKNLRTKSYFSESKNCFQDEFDEIVCLWDNESSNASGVGISMLDEFVEKLKNNDEFVIGYEFEDEDKIKLWIVVKDSVSDKADEIYSDFLDTYDERYSLMIYDNEVLENVENQVKFITNNYKVIDKDGCKTS